MKVKLFYEKTVHENAAHYFDLAKKLKKKKEGLLVAQAIIEKKLAHLQVEHVQTAKKTATKTEWFEKFRYFYTSDGLLAIGGRDATSNELIIKKYTESSDIVFHTDMAGSPFFILKTGGKQIAKTDASMHEVAQMTAVFSRAWQKGFSTIAVFHVSPDQVTKQANSGESLGKGAFVIRGKTEYIHPVLELFVAKHQDRFAIGTKSSLQKLQATKIIKITIGDTKPSDVAKILKKELELTDADQIIRQLPTGGCKVHKKA